MSSSARIPQILIQSSGIRPASLSGVDVAHFHPPLTAFPTQGVLSADFGQATNLSGFSVSYDALRPTMALGVAVDPRTKAPIPAVAPLATEPPMGMEPTLLRPLAPAITRPTMRDAVNPAEAIAQARSLANRTSRALKGSGTVDGLKFGRILRAIQWNAAEHNDRLTSLKEGVEIAYTIEENEYQGTKYVELRLEDFR